VESLFLLLDRDYRRLTFYLGLHSYEASPFEHGVRTDIHLQQNACKGEPQFIVMRRLFKSHLEYFLNKWQQHKSSSLAEILCHQLFLKAANVVKVVLQSVIMATEPNLVPSQKVAHQKRQGNQIIAAALL
jgi:hypothetical protein